MSRPGNRTELPHPALKALLICERSIREAGTNKVTLVGLFDRIASPTFPVSFIGGLSVYARVTDAQGRYRIRLELVRLDDAQAIARVDTEADIPSRIGSHELTFNIAQLGFERAGRYEFRLFADGRSVGAATLDVVQETQADPDG